MKLVIESAALKVLRKLPKADADALREKLKAFAADPYSKHGWAKAFAPGIGRIRHGDWRAIYRIDGGVLTVFILEIGNRREIY